MMRRFEIFPAVPGNRFRLLINGAQTYPEMLKAIADARETVNLETYILRSDRTGDRFAAVLTEQARAGVEVNLLYDAVGSWGCDPAFLARLRDAGIRVVAFHSVWPWRRRFALFPRNHRKMLVVDGRIAFTGGLNIGDEYADPAEGGGGWRDTHLSVEGPLVGELQRLFLTTWHSAGGPRLAGRLYLPPLPPVGEMAGRVLSNHRRRHRRTIRRAYITAIKAAHERIWIANAYFIPDRGIRRALRNASRRGVDVAVIIPGTTDVAAAGYAGRALVRRLLRAGVRLLEWQGPVMHAKTAVIDGLWSTVGSYNLDRLSLLHNLEVAVTVLGPVFGAEMEAAFRRDGDRCRALDLVTWERRTLREKVLERLAYALRYWL